MSTNPPAAFSRQDTSICSHLAASLHPSASSDIKVKQEVLGPDEPSASAPAATSSTSHGRQEIEKRLTDLVRWAARDNGSKRRKLSAPECQICKVPLTRPWACLSCPFIACSPCSTGANSRQCFRRHRTSQVDGKCNFALEPISGAVFCLACDDMVYSDDLDALYRLTRIRVEEEADGSKEISLIGRARERGAFKPWVSSGQAVDALKTSCRGLRPLLNLSQTCFLSAVLQALIHNPLLKAYFLSDKHNRHVCPNGSRGLAVGKPYVGSDGVGPDREKGCMCCEMDRAFEEFHNDDKSPFGPITMLYAMWHVSAELEGYGQQDAHSFFLAALDQIHAHAKGQLSSCNCIAHQTFAGSLLSSVTCSNCKTTSTTVDPILDVQLDFPTETTDPASLTLTNMLQRFCAEERVGDANKGYECSSCGGGSGAAALRKLLIKRLPPVLSFQLKRFAHNATSTKVELPVKFPSHLDMQPYVETPEQGTRPLPSSLYEYDLFAVVTHEGKLDNGHYWADVLSGDEWWHCDDDKVTPTTLKDVLSQKAYMLFYVKRSLAYAQPMAKLLANSNATANANGTMSRENATPKDLTVPLP